VLNSNWSLLRPSIGLSFLLLFAIHSCFSLAQSNSSEPPGQQSFQLQVRSNLVLVRVLVRDKGGNPIRGLKKGDFRLFDQGKEQTISQFEEIPSGASASSPMPTSSTPAQTTLTFPAPSQKRFIAFYFDDLNSSAADLMQARDAADRYLTTSLQPNDRVAIFSAEKMLSDFTADPRQIHNALAQLRASDRRTANEHPCPDLSDYQAYEILHTNDPSSDAWMTAIAEAAQCPVKIVAGFSKIDPAKPDSALMQPIRMLAQRILDQAQTLTRANLRQFEQVVKAIAPAPGERSIVLVSPGFLSQSEQYTLERVIDRALRAQIVINSLDPKGLAILLRESDASRNTVILPDPRASQARYHLDVSKEFVGADVLSEFAQGTGGLFFHNDNGLKAGFAALTQDPPHYILAFSPRKVKLDGKYHTLKVSFSIKDKSQTIQARRGYFANAEESAPTETASSVSPNASGSAPAAPVAHPGSSAAIGASASASPATSGSLEVSVEPSDAESLHQAAKPIHLHRGSNRLTVDQLKQYLADAPTGSDAELAKQLGKVELTERLDSPTLLSLEARLPGTHSRQALVAQADSAAFLKAAPPNAALPATPSATDQIQWLNSVTNYVNDTLHKLPNFFATRDVTRFADSPARQTMGIFYSYQPIHFIDRLQGTVLYRNRKQVLDAEKEKSAVPDSAYPGLVIEGEFGPILGTVLTDASQTTLTWSHWEPGTKGPLAVYRFAVQRRKSHYKVEYCCVDQGSAIGLFKQISAYHGEIAIDPATGTVLRIAIQADLRESYPLLRADLLVEYGSVEIGGKLYTCPTRSVAILKAYTKSPDLQPESSLLPGAAAGSAGLRYLPVQTMSDDIEFEEYHLFRSESRILPTADN
jgi:VWFA-related protein